LQRIIIQLNAIKLLKNVKLYSHSETCSNNVHCHTKNVLKTFQKLKLCSYNALQRMPEKIPHIEYACLCVVYNFCRAIVHFMYRGQCPAMSWGCQRNVLLFMIICKDISKIFTFPESIYYDIRNQFRDITANSAILPYHSYDIRKIFTKDIPEMSKKNWHDICLSNVYAKRKLKKVLTLNCF